MADDWARARADGEYAISTRGLTLAEQGFIHGSTAAQVAGVANMFYQGVPDLLVLVIDPGRLRSEVRFEAVPGLDEQFPHIYGPIDIDAVVRTRPLEPGPDGHFSFDAADE